MKSLSKQYTEFSTQIDDFGKSLTEIVKPNFWDILDSIDEVAEALNIKDEEVKND